MAYNWNL